jgi:cell division protein FtsI (penicillin-binding protein 3)
MMESVITLNEKRKIPGYRTAGKSGTAQRYDSKCKCYNGFTASFVGVAPVEDPQLVVYVMLDRPTNGNLGSQLALPVVNNILSMALPRYNATPSPSEAPDLPTTFD